MKDQDIRQRFLFDGTDIRGEITTLAASYQAIVAQQQYPSSVATTLGEFLVAASLLSATLKFPGIVSIQAMGGEPLNTIMAECSQGSKLRGIVRGDFDAAAKVDSLKELVGNASLAITIEPEGGERYQGIVPMDASDLSGCLEHYFNQSEQLPTQIKISADKKIASGVLIQQMPNSNSQTASDWEHISALMKTLRSEEQLHLSHTEQLYRLFHEDGVRLFEPEALHFFCSCSRQRTEQALISLGDQEVYDICEQQGGIQITCEFCGESYEFNKANIDEMFSSSRPTLH